MLTVLRCLCRAEFCYTSGAKWKTCDCPQWNEERLLARANQVINRDMPGLPANDPLGLDRVDQAVQMSRDRHNCDHRSCAYTRGRFQCEECLRLRQYILYVVNAESWSAIAAEGIGLEMKTNLSLLDWKRRDALRPRKPRVLWCMPNTLKVLNLIGCTALQASEDGFEMME